MLIYLVGNLRSGIAVMIVDQCDLLSPDQRVAHSDAHSFFELRNPFLMWITDQIVDVVAVVDVYNDKEGRMFGGGVCGCTASSGC